MKKRRTIWAALIITIVVVLWLFLRGMRPVEPDHSAKTEDLVKVREPAVSGTNPGTEALKETAREDARARNLIAAYLTPINFYGKVVDERGDPISRAEIKIATNDNPLSEGGAYVYRKSDSQGYFELTGARGLGVAIWVSKEGYYTTEQSRGRSFVYGGVRGRNDPLNPTPDNPAIFVLKKMGETEPLVHVIRKSIRLPKDGTPVEVDLITSRPVPAGSGHVKFEVWTANQGMDPNRAEPYDWEARVSVPGGGLVERIGEYAFHAPDTGYLPSFETGMEKNARRWRDGFEKDFFVRLANGKFARLTLELMTSGDHFVVLEGYLNPTPGSRNLEFDPKKKAAGAGR